jgi:hypothetical protein
MSNPATFSNARREKVDSGAARSVVFAPSVTFHQTNSSNFISGLLFRRAEGAFFYPLMEALHVQ